jgi:hypothetical protein
MYALPLGFAGPTASDGQRDCGRGDIEHFTDAVLFGIPLEVSNEGFFTIHGS